MTMKIVSGLGSIDEYIPFVQAGADEFFCGYVPYSWSKKYGTVMPLNRREVLCSNVQLGAFSELEILAHMIQTYKKPVHLTFNSLYYLPEQYEKIANIVIKCVEIGFQSYIIADPALIVYLREQGISCDIHLSGEMGEWNQETFQAFKKWNLKRIIFHRKNTIAEMKATTAYMKTASAIETEAFVLNELCQFSGAFCNSLHCDEMGYLCRLPYRLGKIAETAKENSHSSTAVFDEYDIIENNCQTEGYLCGKSGCGLCALWDLQDAGITHLKAVGRGNYTAYMEKDIRNLRTALTILEQSPNKLQFQKAMKHTLFPKGCSQNCYYREAVTSEG